MDCKRCKGKGYVWASFGESDIEKEVCFYCNGKGIIEEADGIPCSECEDGMLVAEGSPHMNDNCEDDGSYFRCDKCKALFNENRQLLHRGGGM